MFKIDNIVNFILGRYKYILTVILLITIPMTFYFFQQEQNNQIDTFIEEDEPNFLIYKKFRETYGNEDVGVIVFKEDNIFTKENIDIIRRLSRILKYTDGVQRVFSLTEAEEVVGIDDSVTFRKIVPEEEELNASMLKEARKKALSNRTISNFLISEDGTTTGIIFEIEPLEEKEKIVLLDKVRGVVAEIAKGKDIHITGTSYGAVEITGLILRDSKILIPVTASIIFIIILIMLRNLPLSILCQLNLFVILLWTLGFFVFCGETFNTATSMIGSIILAISVAVSIHLMSQYKGDIYSSGGDHFKAIGNAIKHVWVPCLLTTLTTVAGFIAFVTSNIVPIRKMGIYTAIGVVFAFIVTMTFLPGLLIVFRNKFIGKIETDIHDSAKSRGSDRFLNILLWVGHFATKRYLLLVISCVVIVIVSIIGIFRITFESNTLDWLPEDNRIVVDTKFTDKNLVGSSSMETLIRAKLPEDNFTNPESLKLIDEAQKFFMKDYDGATFSFSIADYFREINKAFNMGDESYYRIPEDPSEVQDFYEIGDPEVFERIISPDFMEARISVFCKWLSNDEIMGFWDRSSIYLEKHLGDKFTFVHTGESSLWVHMEQDLLYSQIKSISLAFVIIFFLMFFVCRTLSLTAITMIPNVLPIAITLGAIGWLGIPLNSSTVLVSAVTLGISVDVSIHFIVWVRRNISAGMNLRDSLVKTYEDVGKPIVITTVVLFMGFFILIIGSMLPTQTFGILTGISMLIAMVSNLFILPALILLFNPAIKMLSDSERDAHFREELSESKIEPVYGEG